MIIEVTFGGTIADLRRQRNLSQDELAQRSGISRNYISQIETGKATNPSAEVIIKLADVLGTTGAQLLLVLKTTQLMKKEK